ncbi:DNA polymerase III subunit beta [Nitrosococcus wardiae]|uniref:Beta sliding clamp n=2 Tax=Nitrosococcus wardiae TaxID=1814290 RepID=A0A4P7C3P8_9GAMM|nr:DNA polymerase III subunit beta [Nitrosococcus wardiae]
MQFSIEREEIVRHLAIVCGVVERRHTLPILFNVLLSVEDSRLSLTATDLEVEIRTTLEVLHPKGGKTTVSARKFLDICRALPSRAVLEVHHEKGQFHVHSGQSRFTLGTLPAEDFPSTDSLEEVVELELTQAELKQLLHQTVFCMAHQDVRYYLNGLLLELGEEAIYAVATDGHRLAVASLEKGPRREGVHIQSIIPRKAVLELVRLLGESSEPVRLKFGTNQMGAEFQGLSFSTKLIDGQFPDYKRVIPVGCEKRFIADREQFKQALGRVNILTNDKYRGVRLHLSNLKLQATVTNLEQESAEEELEIEYQGESFEIAFNNSYLIDVLNIINTEQVKLEFTNANSSCLITPIGEVGSKYVVMPMRL